MAEEPRISHRRRAERLGGAPSVSVAAHWGTDAALLATVLVWGVNFPVLKAALAVMHPHVINAFRFMFSAVVLGSIYVVRQRQTGDGVLAPLRHRLREIVGLGLLGYVFYQLCFIIGINNTKAGSAALIMASSPLWTALVGYLFGLERLARAAWLGLLLSLLGTVVVILGGAQEVEFGGNALFGNLMMVAASVLWGSYTALSRPVLRGLSPSALSFFGVVVALPILWGLALPYAGTVVWERVDLWVWAAIVFSGGLSTGLAVIVWALAVKRVGASQTAVWGNLVPFVAVLASFLLLAETVGPAQLLGGLLIIAGVVVMRRVR